MKKFVLAFSMLTVALGVTACGDYLNSPEKKAFDQFVAKCKKDPSTADCKAWAESKGGN